MSNEASNSNVSEDDRHNLCALADKIMDISSAKPIGITIPYTIRELDLASAALRALLEPASKDKLAIGLAKYALHSVESARSTMRELIGNENCKNWEFPLRRDKDYNVYLYDADQGVLTACGNLFDER
jgi:hypothetical protein